MQNLVVSHFQRQCRCFIAVVLCAAIAPATLSAQSIDKDWVRDLQTTAVLNKNAAWGYWGSSPRRYSNWTSHTNRLIPVYIFGGNLNDYMGPHSLYRNEQQLRELYGELPQQTLNPQAEYLDQTDLYRLQLSAWKSGKKKYIFLLIADGMDWQTTQAAAIYRSGGQIYREGRGNGMAIQDYKNADTDFGWMVTSASHASVKIDINAQRVLSADAEMTGGYNAELGGNVPWANGASQEYLMGQTKPWKHLVTDSASSASSMTAGLKTYNSAINVDVQGREIEPIARQVQAAGWSIGVVTSVPISHATPACAYSNNVDRDDYQDLTRDLLGIPSAFRHTTPLTGVDVLIGCGWGEHRSDDRGGQGNNFVPGNRYLAETDRQLLIQSDSPYFLCERTSGMPGNQVLQNGVELSLANRRRLLGFFGTQGGHLPYRTADGDYRPTRGVVRMDQYTAADILENPTLPQMTRAALQVLDSRKDQGIWLMVESGDVDWANHNNNIDDSIGAVLSFDEAFLEIVHWIESKNVWDESLVIVTADHGHGLILTDPTVFSAPSDSSATHELNARSIIVDDQ